MPPQITPRRALASQPPHFFARTPESLHRAPTAFFHPSPIARPPFLATPASPQHRPLPPRPSPRPRAGPVPPHHEAGSARCRCLSLCTNHFARINSVTPSTPSTSTRAVLRSSHRSAVPPRQSRHRVPLAILTFFRRLSICARLASLVKLLSAYTQTSTPTARTDAFMHPYLLPPDSSFPCADHPQRTHSRQHRSTLISSPAPPLRGYTAAFLHVESSPGPLLAPTTVPRRASAHSLVKLAWV
jgi:hypothetical protein